MVDEEQNLEQHQLSEPERERVIMPAQSEKEPLNEEFQEKKNLQEWKEFQEELDAFDGQQSESQQRQQHPIQQPTPPLPHRTNRLQRQPPQIQQSYQRQQSQSSQMYQQRHLQQSQYLSQQPKQQQQSQQLSNIEPWQDPSARPYVSIKNLTKTFGEKVAVNNVSLSIYRGELFSLLGRSGCGKSTLLRMLAGFESPTSGKIFIDGVDMTDTPPYKRPVSMVFQSYALFPHMTVEQNVAFGLIQEGMQKGEIKDRVNAYLELVQMVGYEKRKPNQLSGGERQRVALARSLVKHPKLVLLDEPLAALDKKLRERTQLELVNIQEKVGVTFIMVSHDQEEAMTMSTRIGLMREGRILQVGGPTEIYEYPNSKYVANFIGSVNLFDGIIIEEQSDHVIVKSTAMEKNLLVTHSASVPVGAQISVAIRPEKVVLTTTAPSGEYNWTSGIVQDIVYLGDVSIYHVQLASGVIVLATVANLVRAAERPIQWDDEVFLCWKPENGIILAI